MLCTGTTLLTVGPPRLAIEQTTLLPPNPGVGGVQEAGFVPPLGVTTTLLIESNGSIVIVKATLFAVIAVLFVTVQRTDRHVTSGSALKLLPGESQRCSLRLLPHPFPLQNRALLNAYESVSLAAVLSFFNQERVNTRHKYIVQRC
jgi:hypothetical protein